MNSDTRATSGPGQPHPKSRLARWRFCRQAIGWWWWWCMLNMRFSDLPHLGRFFTWLAGLPLGPHRAKVPLSWFKPYISPRAEVYCPDLHLSQGCYIDALAVIWSGQGGGSVNLARDVHINRGTIIEVAHGSTITIGEHTHVQAYCNLYAYAGNIRIGNYVMIAPKCALFPYQHKVDDLSEMMEQQGFVSKGDIVIEDDVWLGTGAKIMDGVRIGRGAIVGAGAVVTRDIPPYTIAAGVPARVIRKREGCDNLARECTKENLGADRL